MTSTRLLRSRMNLTVHVRFCRQVGGRLSALTSNKSAVSDYSWYAPRHHLGRERILEYKLRITVERVVISTQEVVKRHHQGLRYQSYSYLNLDYGTRANLPVREVQTPLLAEQTVLIKADLKSVRTVKAEKEWHSILLPAITNCVSTNITASTHSVMVEFAHRQVSLWHQHSSRPGETSMRAGRCLQLPRSATESGETQLCHGLITTLR